MPNRTRSNNSITKSKLKPKQNKKRVIDPYTLTLSGKDYRNLVIYGPDLQPLYHIETHACAASKTERTLVFQQDDPEGRQIYPIAVLDFYVDTNEWREDMMAYDGTRQPLARYWPRKSKAQCVLCFFKVAVSLVWTLILF